MKTSIKIALIFIASSVLAETTRFDRIKETNQMYTASQAEATFTTKAELNLAATAGTNYTDTVAQEGMEAALAALRHATTNLNARPISILSDQTHIDAHGDVRNGPVEIGEGAIAIADTSEVPTNVPIRSVSVAIGAGADARDLVHPDKQQAIAIGNNARASGVNAIAIGSGVRHTDEDNITGNNAYALGAQAISIGYSAKSITNNAVQIGTGTNNTPHSLQFEDTVIVRDGKVVSDGMDTNAVRALIQAESDKGLMYGSTGSTNGFVYIRMAGYNSAQDTDPEFVVAISTNENADVAASFPLFPGSPNRRDVYSVATVDRLLGECVKTNSYPVFIGSDAKVLESDSGEDPTGISIGEKTVAGGVDGIAIGFETKAIAEESIAIGTLATATNKYSVAIGTGTRTHGNGTFNVLHGGTAANFYIGESNLVDIVNALIDARLAAQQGE